MEIYLVCSSKQLNTHEGRYALTTEGDLQIVQLHRTDSGTYVCVAGNGIGEPVSREVSLTVTGEYIYDPSCFYGCCLWIFEWNIFFCPFYNTFKLNSFKLTN